MTVLMYRQFVMFCDDFGERTPCICHKKPGRVLSNVLFVLVVPLRLQAPLSILHAGPPTINYWSNFYCSVRLTNYHCMHINLLL